MGDKLAKAAKLDRVDKIIFSFPVLCGAWTDDTEAWVMERHNKKRYLRMTFNRESYNPGVETLYRRITEYKDVLRKTRKAVTLLIEPITKKGKK